MATVAYPNSAGIDIGPDDIVIAPQPGPQTRFLRAKADIVIYGGAAGG